MRPRVLVVERPSRDRIDISRAEEHGEVVVLTDHMKTNVSAFEPGAYVRHISEALDAVKFDPANDYICVVGPILPVSLLVTVAAARHEVVTLLCYHVHMQKYVPRTLDMRRHRHEDAHRSVGQAPPSPSADATRAAS